MSEEIEPITPVPSSSGSELHSLKSVWVFWYLIPSRTGQNTHWSVYLHPLHSFSVVEDFWRLLNSVEHPEKLLKGCRYYVFRKDIKPLWEDPIVAGGQIISVEIPKEGEKSQGIRDKWVDLVLYTIGEGYSENESVIGVEFNSRPESWKVAVWVKRNSPSISAIAEKMKAIVPDFDVTISDIEPE